MAKRNRNGLRGWHRWLGLALAAPLIGLAITGIMLNHTDDLDLGEHYADQAWLLALYGVEPVPPQKGFHVDGGWVSQARETLLLNAKPIGRLKTPLVAALPLDGMIAVVARDHVRLFVPDGRLVERVSLPDALSPVHGAAAVHNRLVLRTPRGMRASDSALAQWQAYDGEWPGSASARELPATLREAIANRLASQTLTWERVLLDLHSGRLFGRYGPLAMDAVAAVLIGLAITGCVLWWRSRGRRR